MISITQDLKFKQAVVEYSFKHGGNGYTIGASGMTVLYDRWRSIPEDRIHTLTRTRTRN